MGLHLLETLKVKGDTVRYLFYDEVTDMMYYGHTGRNEAAVKAGGPSRLHREGSVDPDKLYPQAELEMTFWNCEEHTGEVAISKCFIKRPGFLNEAWVFRDRPSYFACLTYREIEVCESLKKKPHINVCPYFGVSLDKRNRVIGLAFKKYDRDLEHVLENGIKINRAHIMSCVRAGVSHLHSQGLIHCDIKPANIFVNENEVVIGDFNSVHEKGQPLALRRGTKNWMSEHYDWHDPAEERMDEYSLALLSARLQRYEEFRETKPFKAREAWKAAMEVKL